jgi:hypothetical protein
MSVKTFTLNCPVCGGPMRIPRHETAEGAMASAASVVWIAACHVHGLFRLGPATDVPISSPVRVRHRGHASGPSLTKRKVSRRFFASAARARELINIAGDSLR